MEIENNISVCKTTNKAYIDQTQIKRGYSTTKILGIRMAYQGKDLYRYSCGVQSYIMELFNGKAYVFAN